MADYKSFYDERREKTYAHNYEKTRAENHDSYDELKTFIDTFQLKDKKCLEIGSSGGFFQDMVNDYYGTDIADTLAQYYHKPYKVGGGGYYPFDNEEFDAIWTFYVFEHIPELQTALLEIKRLLKPSGIVLFKPAWQCRPWAAQGYGVRPYRDFNWKGKLIKASIPIRNSILWRSLFILPKRMVRHVLFLLGYKFIKIRYRKLKANYDIFWESDSDACNWIDPHDAILWFLSHNFECLSHKKLFSMLFVRTGALIFRKVGNRVV
jgi:SAM-dependent methyltransferase